MAILHDLLRDAEGVRAAAGRLEHSAGAIVAEIVGAGRSEVAQAIFGVEPPLAGKVTLDGTTMAIHSAQDAMRHGVFRENVPYWAEYERIANALLACMAYLGKTIWPASLAIFYPYPEGIVPFSWQVAASALGLALIFGVMRVVQVPLGQRSYPIRIGQPLLARVGPACRRLGLGTRCAIISWARLALRATAVKGMFWSISQSMISMPV